MGSIMIATRTSSVNQYVICISRLLLTLTGKLELLPSPLTADYFH